MAILKKKIRYVLSFLRKQESIKLKASTLIESLVASVLIIVIFAIASLTLNNVFKNTVRNNQDRIQNRMHTLAYLYANNKIEYPYHEDFEKWKIQLVKSNQNNSIYFVLEAKQVASKKVISRKLSYAP